MSQQNGVTHSSHRKDLGRLHIYCISGLASDERIFAKCQFPGYEVHYIKWIIPTENESIGSYANRLVQQIYHPNPILIGLSFGGIMSIEISKQINVEFIILVSSVKSLMEMPVWMRLAGKLKLNKIFSMKPYNFLEPLQDNNLSLESADEKILVHEYRKNANPVYIKWAINEIINWKHILTSTKIYHIHGDKDRIFPIKNIKSDYTISGGHLMILNRSEKINECINSILKNHKADC